MRVGFLLLLLVVLRRPAGGAVVFTGRYGPGFLRRFATGGASRYIVRVQYFVYKMDDYRVSNLDYFPENILIDILSYLGVRELVRAGR